MGTNSIKRHRGTKVSKTDGIASTQSQVCAINCLLDGFSSSYYSSVFFQQTEFRNQRVYAGTLSNQSLCYRSSCQDLAFQESPGKKTDARDYTKQLQSRIYRQPLIEQPHLTRVLFNQSLVSKS